MTSNAIKKEHQSLNVRIIYSTSHVMCDFMATEQADIQKCHKYNRADATYSHCTSSDHRKSVVFSKLHVPK